ncbi:hypothetical protein NGB36_26085 [Streptomyces sp. RB6PN25]|uniref:Secreted protein n=1 Tax=Streptomyces humicola TaxID=2953240 RepID=A0ABT1Q215_9ACTN|nr:hypothetical protein [Streptomyces humicola]MCQ4083961.1 hypothetical protein [Streptomyces humicola]
MNDTVAVALITSLSTLTAAGLAGSVSAWTANKQLRHQALLAREERAEQRATDHRQMRREAYERFLSHADAAYRVLDERWLARLPAESQHGGSGFAARRALDEAYIRVRLVGPEDVAERGAAVVRGIGNEFHQHARVVNSHPDTEDCVVDLDPSARAQALRVRGATTGEFVAAARRALGGEFSLSPDVPAEEPRPRR